MDNDELLQILRSKFGSVKTANKGWHMIKCPTCSPKDANKRKRGVNFDVMKTRCWICEEPLSVKDLLGENFEPIRSSVVIEDVVHPQARIIPATGVIPIHELPATHQARKLFEDDYLTDFKRYWEDNQIGYISKEAAIPVVYTHEDKADTSVNTGDSLVFPVSFKGELVGWQLRFLNNGPKFRYFHIFKKGDYLYNYDKAIDYKLVVVVEGVKKALKFPNAVCTFGKNISDNQIQKLMNWDHIAFMYDGEDQTQKKVSELVAELRLNRRCINIDPRKYGYDSPDSMPQDVAQKIVFLEWQSNYPNG